MPGNKKQAQAYNKLPMAIYYEYAALSNGFKAQFSNPTSIDISQDQIPMTSSR